MRRLHSGMVKAKRDRYKTPVELFNQAVETFNRGEVAEALALLRAGFFENLYIAPMLLGDEFQPQEIWHAGPQGQTKAAEEYVSRYRSLWEENPQGIPFLRVVWNDPLVRNEVKSYVNLCKSLNQVGKGRRWQDLVKERERFVSLERIRRTQIEILQRISKSSLEAPVERPFLGLVMLSSMNPAESVKFYKKLFGIEPYRTSEIAGGYAEFDFHGIRVAVHGYNQHGHGDPYGLGPPPKSLGWGAFFVIRVNDFDRYYDNAVQGDIQILDCDLHSRGVRFFVVKDPSGYVFEITEEELYGLTGQ